MTWREEQHPRHLAGSERGQFRDKWADAVDADLFERRVARAAPWTTAYHGLRDYGALSYTGRDYERYLDDPKMRVRQATDEDPWGSVEVDMKLATEAKIDWWENYASINVPLRGQHREPGPGAHGTTPILSHSAAVAALDQRMEGSHFREEAVATRLVDGSALTEGEWIDPGYVALLTPLGERELAGMVRDWQMSDPVVLRVLVPAGTPGLVLQYNEALLARGLRYRIVAERASSKIRGRKVRNVDVEVLP